MTRFRYPSQAFILLSFLIGAPIAAAEGQGGTRAVMADAMAKMMEAMGMFNPSSGDGLPMDPRSMSSPFGGPAPPWASPFRDPAGAMGMGEEMMRRVYPNMPAPAVGGQPYPWIGSSLDGTWEGRSGELLIVQGKRFRIYSGGGYIDGYLHAQGNRLAMYNPETEQARPFEYAQSEDRLVLRDGEGQIYLYRRLRLDAAQPEASIERPRR